MSKKSILTELLHHALLILMCNPLQRRQQKTEHTTLCSTDCGVTGETLDVSCPVISESSVLTVNGHICYKDSLSVTITDGMNVCCCNHAN